MRNGNVYKKFCAIMIVLGLILCGGQLAYAHNPELEQWKTIAQNKPTSANLERLCVLFLKDIENHRLLGQKEEAEKSKEDMLDTTLKVAMAAKWSGSTEKTAEHFENEQRCWEQIATLNTEFRYNDKAKAFKANAAMARANYNTMIAYNSPTQKNFNNAAMHYDKVAELYEEVHDTQTAKAAKAVAARAKMNAMIMEQPIGVEAPKKSSSYGSREIRYFANVAKQANIAANLYKECGDSKGAADAKFTEAWAWTQRRIRSLSPDFNMQMAIEKEERCWTEAANLYEEIGDSTNAAIAKVKAATIRAELTYYEIAPRDSALYWHDEIAAKCWDEAARLAKEAGITSDKAEAKAHAALHRANIAEIETLYNKKVPESFKTAAECWDKVVKLSIATKNSNWAEFAKMKAARARAQQAEIIAQDEKTPESLINVAECWDEIVKITINWGTATTRQNRICVHPEEFYLNPYLANEAKMKATKARAQQAEMTENWNIAVQYWDEAAELAIADKNTSDVKDYRAKAAWAMAKQTESIARDEKTSENYENEAQCWDKAADLCTTANAHEKAEIARKNAARATADAKKNAEMTREHLNDNSNKKGLDFNK